MALECDISTKNENEEEDIGCYFLQPSSSPYNITEKVRQANFDLFNSTPQATRSTRVRFRDELVSFEPELTDDDVNSIESDHVAEDLNIGNDAAEFKDEETILPYNTVLRGGMDMFDIEEEIDDAIYEELVLSDDNEANVLNENETHQESDVEDTSPVPQPDGISNSGPVSVTSRKSTKRKRHASKTLGKQTIRCSEHCIERLDSRLSMSIKKLEIQEKPLVSLPPLHLHQRKCCDEFKLCSDKNLPNYTGYRSEYGLNARQIKNRDRYLEMIRQKEAARRKLIEEYRALKIQRNEEIFCQWLKDVSRRKEQRAGKYGTKTSSPPAAETTKERPKTAGFLPKTNVKKPKRPHTSQSCVYIEISPGDLKRGIHIGDLLVTNQKELNKKLHILTVS